MPALESCFGCGALVPVSDGPTHRYLGAAPGCWAAYGALLARGFGGQLPVDTYCVQHPGVPSPQSIQSVAVHLISLYFALERRLEPSNAVSVLRRAAAYPQGYVWLTPPSNPGTLTVLDVMQRGSAEEYHALVQGWAEAVWEAWSGHHDTVRRWASAIYADR